MPGDPGIRPERITASSPGYKAGAFFCRKRLAGNAPQLRKALQHRSLQTLKAGDTQTPRIIPRISFWLRLCQAGSLLDEGSSPYPTLLADEWVTWPFFDQAGYLLRSWLRVPVSDKFRRIRQKLLENLLQGDALLPAQKQELAGLQALGFCTGEKLTPLGHALLTASSKETWLEAPPLAWKIEDNQLVVPFPPDWGLLWELEKYLEPSEAGVYPLDTDALRQAVQQEAGTGGPGMMEIIKTGTGEPLPESLIQQLASQPIIRVIHGPVLEFTSAEELLALRKFPALRRDLEQLLSPRHVVLDPYRARTVLLRLRRQGHLSEADIQWEAPFSVDDINNNCFTTADRVYLLSLMLFASGVQNIIAPPPGLLKRLTKCGKGGIALNDPLRAVAAKKATQILNSIRPEPDWIPSDDPLTQPSNDLLSTLQLAINEQTTLDVLYQASGRHTLEARHISPLLLEKRGPRYYLIAWCHTRRARRTFRLDRLKLKDG